MIRFTFPVVSHDRPRAKVDVRVFETGAAMRRSLRRHHRKTGKVESDAWYLEAAATTERFHTQCPGGPWRYEAQIRLVRGDCGSIVVSHEACHAAIYFYQYQIQRTVPDIRREEILCHLVSEITGKIVNALYDLGVYERAT